MSERPTAEEAVRRATEVVGLYGDPDVTWGISVELAFADALDLTGATPRLHELVLAHPHLGATPVVEEVAEGDWDQCREQVASGPLGEDGQLVRVLVDASARRVFVTAHHGVTDGLGLLAVAGAVADTPVVSRARGIGDRPARRAFLVSSVLRLLEALLVPPARFSGSGVAVEGGSPDALMQVATRPRRLDGATIAYALRQVFRAWPRNRTSGGHRFLVFMGASRRTPGVTTPDRQTAYLRIPLRPTWSVDRIREVLRETAPEPDFPETSAGGAGPVVVRLLRNRLGCTVNVSNLGRVEAEGLLWVAMFPALNGPMAVGVGVASTRTCSTVSLRTRRADFTAVEASALLAALDEQLPPAQD